MDGRHLALKVLYQINEENAYANLALDEALRKNPGVDPRDRGLATELVYGCTKYRGRLDWVINQFAKPKVEKMAPWIRNIIRLGLYQLIFLDKVPASAAINEAVKLAKKYGHQGTVKFVNGVLRNIQRNLDKIKYPNFETNPVEHLQVVYSHPYWMVKDWVERFGPQGALELCKYNNNPSPLWIRTNTLKNTRAELKEKLALEGVETVESSRTTEGLRIIGNVAIGQLSSFKQGLFTVQDESSILVGHSLIPKPGQVLLDVCSGPGGKTSHLAQLMENQGRILAFDVHEHRLKLIEETCDRLGIKIVETILHDARQLRAIIKEQADGILVDAPCSGLGVLGRRPDARWQKRPEDITELVKIQKAILNEVAPLVKSGGTLVYSTCTITFEENNQVVEDFLATHEEFYLDKDLPKYLSLPNLGEEGWVQFLPHIHNIDGFFIARMEKK